MSSYSDAMAIVTVTDKDFEEKVLKSSLPVIIDFWATWCGPCKLAEPVLEELSERYKDKVNFVKMDVDQSQLPSSKYQVMSIPTTVLFKNGNEVARQIGFSGKKAFEDLILKGVS